VSRRTLETIDPYLASLHCKTDTWVGRKDGVPNKESTRVLRENLGKLASQSPIVLHEWSDDAAIDFERIAQSLGKILDPLVSRWALGTAASFDASPPSHGDPDPGFVAVRGRHRAPRFPRAQQRLYGASAGPPRRSSYK
jgi:hypothetical protein